MCEAIATLQAQQREQQQQQLSLQNCFQQLLQNNLQNNAVSASLNTANTGTQGTFQPVGNVNNQQQLPAADENQVQFLVHPTTTSTANLNPAYGFDSQQLLNNTGTSFNINNPYLPPPISKECLTKIKNLDYVDFGALLTSILPNSLNMAMITEGEDDEEFCLSQISAPGAAATFRKKTRRNAIPNFPTWVMAWNVFYETTLHFFPEKHHQLFAYFKHISEYAVCHKFKFLAAYDKAHRIHIAAQRNLPSAAQTSSWTKHCPSTYNLYLKDNMIAQCNNCLGWGHIDKMCPKIQKESIAAPIPTFIQPQPPQPQPTNSFRNVSSNSNLVSVANNASFGKSTCFRYNRGKPCQQAQCSFPHICRLCFQQGLRLNHPAFQCPNTTSTVFRPGQ